MADLIIGDRIVIFRNEIPIRRFKELIGNINMSNDDLIRVLNEELVVVNEFKSIKITKMTIAGRHDTRICYEEYENKEIRKGNMRPIHKRIIINKKYHP